MYDYSNKETRGTTPYTAPRVVIYENKAIKYDEVGQIKAIVDIVTKEEKKEIELKKHLVKIFAILFAIAFFIEFVRFCIFDFTPWKWQHFPKMRTVMSTDLQKKSKKSMGEDSYIKTIMYNHLDFFEDDYKAKTTAIKSVDEKYSLLLCKPEEVHNILGEPDFKRVVYAQEIEKYANDEKAEEYAGKIKELKKYTEEYFEIGEKKKSKYYVVVEYYAEAVIDVYAQVGIRPIPSF